MLKERVIALKDQEEKLGAMVAALQVAKAREVSMPPPPPTHTPTVLKVNKIKGQYIPPPQPSPPQIYIQVVTSDLYFNNIHGRTVTSNCIVISNHCVIYLLRGLHDCGHFLYNEY